MSLAVPESSLTSEELARLSLFTRDLAEALDEALADAGDAGSGHVDLTLPPYSVVANDTSAAATNVTAINQAITDYSGTKARLVLPRGVVYVDQAGGGTSNWCIKFGPGVTDLELVGHGAYATRVSQFGAGDGGASSLIVFDQCSRCTVHDLGVDQTQITTPDPIQDNHLILVTNTGAGTTTDISGWNLYFGKSLGDQLRFLGDTAIIENIHFHHFVMHGAGVVTSTPANGRTGSRSGVAFQRNFSKVTLDHFYIDGAQNSPFDMEITGTGTSNEHLSIADFIIDNTLSNTSAAMSLGGVSAGDRVSYLTVRHGLVIGGAVNTLSTNFLTVSDLVITASTAFAADPTNPLLTIRQINNDLEMSNVTIVRDGTCGNGNCFDLEGQTSNRQRYQNITCVQGVPGNPFIFEGGSNVTIHGVSVRYDAASPSAYNAVLVQAVNYAVTGLRVRDVSAYCSTGKLAAAVRIDTRTSTSSQISIVGVESSGYASTGVYISRTAGTIETSPEIREVSNVGDAMWAQADETDNAVTTLYPLIGGNRGSVANFIGDAAPEGAVSAVQGSTCVFMNGDSTALYFKSTGTGNTGWTAVTVP